MLKKRTLLYLLFFTFLFITYWATSSGNTPYNYFIKLAEAFLNGRYWLIENPPWLNELIVGSPGKFFVPYPPMPAILALPFVFAFGNQFPQQILCHLLGVGITFLTVRSSLLIKKDYKIALFVGILTGLGTILWFMSATGSVWYLGQISAAFFLTAAINETLGKKRPLLIGILVGAAYLSRVNTLMALPFFLFLIPKDKNLFKNLALLALGLFPFLGINSLYNFLRFGVVWDKGYALIPNVLNEPWYQKGLVSLSYIPRHLKVFFLSLPKFTDKFPFVYPSWGGLAIWITTPTFIYAFLASWKEKIVKLSWLSIGLISLIIFSHGTTGFTQFGYRFAVDFYPFLLLLIIKSLAKTGLKWHHWALLFISVLVNLWGVIFINKLGLVSF